MTAPTRDHLEVIRRSGLLDLDHELGRALREAIDVFVEEGDGCTDAVGCATEGHVECRAHPIEFLDWLKLATEPPAYDAKGSHLGTLGRAKVVRGQRRRWHGAEASAVA